MTVKPITKTVNPLDPAGHAAAWRSNLSAAHRRGATQSVQTPPKIPNWNRRK